MSSMNFPDPNVTPEYKDWVWDGEKWVKDCASSGGGSGDSGGGAGMVISDTEPADKVTGMQWLEAGTSKVWIWDEDKWLRFPAADGLTEGGGGGGAWESIAVITADAADSFEVDLDPSEFMSYKFFLDVLPSAGGAETWVQLHAGGSWITDSSYLNTFHSGKGSNWAGGSSTSNKWELGTKSQAYQNSSHWSAVLSGIGVGSWYPSMSFIGAGSTSTSDTISWSGACSANIRLDQVGPIEKIKFWAPSKTWKGSLTVEGLRRV